MQSFHYPSIDSTQNQAKRLIDDAKIIDQACIVASEQTAGRGQYGKSWASPQGAGIYLSLIQVNGEWSTVNGLEALVASYTVEVAKKVIDVLNEIYQADYYIKPINDIYYDGAKLAGILVEIYKGYIITGIGINLRNVPRTLKESIVDQPKAPPISLEEILPDEIFSKLQEQDLINKLLTLTEA